MRIADTDLFYDGNFCLSVYVLIWLVQERYESTEHLQHIKNEQSACYTSRVTGEIQVDVCGDLASDSNQRC